LEPLPVTMRKFQYRAPRFPVDLPIRLRTQHASFAGRCKEINHEGMKVEVLSPLPADTEGAIFIDYYGASIEVNVRIAQRGEAHHGLEFLYQSDRERRAIAYLLAAVSLLPRAS
jgi:PilZ domain